MPQSYREITLRYPEPASGRDAAKMLTRVLDPFETCEAAVRAIPGIGEVVVSDRVVTPVGPRKKAAASKAAASEAVETALADVARSAAKAEAMASALAFDLASSLGEEKDTEGAPDAPAAPPDVQAPDPIPDTPAPSRDTVVVPLSEQPHKGENPRHQKRGERAVA